MKLLLYENAPKAFMLPWILRNVSLFPHKKWWWPIRYNSERLSLFRDWKIEENQLSVESLWLLTSLTDCDGSVRSTSINFSQQDKDFLLAQPSPSPLSAVIFLVNNQHKLIVTLSLSQALLWRKFVLWPDQASRPLRYKLSTVLMCFDHQLYWGWVVVTDYWYKPCWLFSVINKSTNDRIISQL